MSMRRGVDMEITAWNGKIEIVQLLLERGADVNVQGGKYGNALQAAAREGSGCQCAGG